MAGQTIGIVLAGGQSSRMGRDKAQLPWQGTCLLDRMCRLLSETGVDRVVVSGNRAGYECFPDTEPGSGPGFALSGVLARLPAHARALIVPIDMPLLTPALLGRLLAYPAACFADHPLPAVLPAGEALQGHSIKGLHRVAGSVTLQATPEEVAILVNANTPEEWQRMQEIAR